MKVVEKGILILADSIGNEKLADSMPYKDERKKILDSGTIEIREDEKIVFKKDYLCKSLSQAAALIVGRSISGPSYWGNHSVKQLKEKDEKVSDDSVENNLSIENSATTIHDDEFDINFDSSGSGYSSRGSEGTSSGYESLNDDK
jgi:hypothetical protein